MNGSFQCRLIDAAPVHDQRTAGMKRAARWRVQHVRRLARNGLQRLVAANVPAGDRFEQTERVGVLRLSEKGLGSRKGDASEATCRGTNLACDSPTQRV